MRSRSARTGRWLVRTLLDGTDASEPDTTVWQVSLTASHTSPRRSHSSFSLFDGHPHALPEQRELAGRPAVVGPEGRGEVTAGVAPGSASARLDRDDSHVGVVSRKSFEVRGVVGLR